VKITYGSAESNVWQDFGEMLRTHLHDGARVADLGGGAHPFLSPDDVRKQNLQYSVLDISRDELLESPAMFERIVFDVCADLRTARTLTDGEAVELTGRFDIAFSLMMAEHIEHPDAFHQNVFRMLCPGGYAVHAFPTVTTLPFLVNKILPEAISAFITRLLAPARRHERAKFPAYYRWCLGPVKNSIDRFKAKGWEIVEYRGYFGHPYYAKLPLLKQVHNWKSAKLEHRPLPWLTSYAVICLRKPGVQPD
jgi:2-polyprenyl-3-methyl-5-hydroxy-6-metoxy-1,4-benzoquinol methylase